MSLTELLAATDLDELCELHAELGAPTAQDRELAARTLADWSGPQAISNLLQYPDLIPGPVLVPALLRGLGEGPGSYLCLAAAVGVGQLVRGRITGSERAELCQALLDVIADDGGTVADRAAASLPTVVTAAGAVELVVLLAHPSEAVCRNVGLTLFGVLGPAGVSKLISDQSLPVADRAAAAAALARSGFDLRRPAAEQPVAWALAYLPALSEWDGQWA